MLSMTDGMGKSRLFNWHYDAQGDVFFIHKTRPKTFTCLEFGDLVLDVDRNYRLLGMEVLWASELFARLGISVELLKRVDDAVLDLVTPGEFPVVQLTLRSGKTERKVLVPTAMAVALAA